MQDYHPAAAQRAQLCAQGRLHAPGVYLLPAASCTRPVTSRAIGRPLCQAGLPLLTGQLPSDMSPAPLSQDIKPANVLLHWGPQDGVCVKIADFGLATKWYAYLAPLACDDLQAEPGLLRMPDVVCCLGPPDTGMHTQVQ